MLTWVLTSRAGQALSAMVAGIVAVLTFGAIKKREGRKEAEAKQARDYINTRKRIDAADTPGDPDSAREWLKRRGDAE